MVATITDLTNTNVVEVANVIKGIFETNKETIGVKYVTYGDPNLVAQFPAVTVRPLTKRREDHGTHRWMIRFTVGIVILWGKVGDITLTQEQTDNYAQAVEGLLLPNLQLDGNVIFGTVRSMDFGVIRRGTNQIQAARCIWEGMSQQQFVG